MGNAKVVQFPLTDEGVLLAAAHAGDRWAFEQLFRRELTVVTRFLSRLVGHDADVPDLANEVMVLGWNAIQRRRGGLRLGPFLSGVCVNVARNHLRSRRRRSWLVFGASDADTPVPERTEAREALNATYSILNQLDDEQRLAFVLRFIDGRELAEVADLLGVSLATAKRRLRDAQDAFVKRARRHPALDTWVAAERWGGA